MKAKDPAAEQAKEEEHWVADWFHTQAEAP
jgi:hypothetical protein